MKLFSFIACFAFSSLIAQNTSYIEYQKTFNRMDEDILGGHPEYSLQRLDSISENYQFIFAKHCLKAIQISVACNDSSRAFYWTRRAFRQGLPLWVFDNDSLCATIRKFSTYKIIFQEYDSLYKLYLSGINLPLRKTVDSLFEIDQKRTQRVNDGFVVFRYSVYYLQWLRNNKKQINFINSLNIRYGFAAESIIGLPLYLEDSSVAAGLYRKRGAAIFSEKSLLFMYLHYYSSKRKEGASHLQAYTVNGELPVLHFANICDFIAEYSKHKNESADYYNSWHSDADSSHVPQIEIRRKSIGLNSISAQKRNETIWLNARKQRRMNKLFLFE